MISELIELVHIITKKKVQQIEIISEDVKINTKSKILLDAIRSGKVKSDHEALSLLYENGNKNAYNKLKNRLYNRLLNTLFFIDIKQSGGSIGAIRADAFKTYSQIMILKRQGHLQLASKIARRLIEKTKNIEILELKFLLSSFLIEYYSTWEINKKLAAKYEKQYENTRKNLEAVRAVTPVWSELADIIISKKSSNISNQKIASLSDKLIELEKFYENSDSNIFNFRFFSAKYFYCWLLHDFDRQVELCEEAVTILEEHQSPFLAHIVAFKTYRGVAELNQSNYLKANTTFKDILKEFELTPGKTHWYNIYNYFFLVKMTLGEYNQASMLLIDVLNLKNFSKVEAKWREPWLIKEAYINILLELGKIKDEFSTALKKRSFRLRKFLNTVPQNTKDKSGLNVSILVAQFLFLLIRDNTEELYDKLDSLKQYTHRYLKKDNTLRSNLFIRMLMTLPKSDFHPVRVEARTKDFWKKLQATPMMVSEQSHEVEIIPYEHLWEIVMEILHDRVKKKKSARR